MSLALALLSLSTHAVAVETELRDLTWVYKPSNGCNATVPCGPNEWHLLPNSMSCNETGTQSPIDISSTSLASTEKIVFHAPIPDMCASAAFLINEHTTEVELHESEECSFKVEFAGSEFEMKQYHHHAPSEHTLDGKYYPLEIHHVHVSATGQALVVSVLVNVGTPAVGAEATRAAYINDTLAKMPVPAGNFNFHEWEEEMAIAPYDFLPLDATTGFYHYSGSFTTPPCTTDTQWIVLDTPVVIPQSTFDTYLQLISANFNSQLAPFSETMNLTAGSIPSWTPVSSGVVYDSAQGANARPIQAAPALLMKAAAGNIEVKTATAATTTPTAASSITPTAAASPTAPARESSSTMLTHAVSVTATSAILAWAMI